MNLADLTRRYFKTMKLGDQELGSIVDGDGDVYNRHVRAAHAYVEGLPGVGDVSIDSIRMQFELLRREGL